jgi:hypothetical protein
MHVAAVASAGAIIIFIICVVAATRPGFYGFAPLFPVALLTGIVPVFLVVFFFNKIDPTVAKEVVINLGVVLIGVALIGLLVAGTCMTVRPTERFVDGFESGSSVSGSGSPTLGQLWKDIGAAERDVCDLVTRANEFIQGEVGHPGIDNPTLVSAAIESERSGAGGPLVNCPTGGDYDERADEAENRINRLEHTVRGFTNRPIEAAYKRSDTCHPETAPVVVETFDDQVNGLVRLNERLTAVREQIEKQKSWLRVVDEKTAAMQRGEVSDCDKAAGTAKIEMDISANEEH